MPQVYVLSLLHFNLQYCAGGLEGLLQDWPADDASLQDQIVEESFVPVLAMLEAHPTWQMDLELQAYMVEVLAERHPDTLDRLRALADSGQVELVSWHWSDQLWTAFPWRDQEASLRLTREVFEAHGLPLSDVVFTQEGQFGQGMLERMPAYGYRTAVLPKNLAEHMWGAEPTLPLFRYGDDVLVVPGGTWANDPGGAFQVQWHFLDDGELYATGDMNCYLGSAFVHDPEAVAAQEADLAAREAAGARIVSVGTYAAEVAGLATEPLPPVFDGTWQPDDTDNLHLWMGGGGLWVATEDDNGVRTANVRTSLAIAAASAVPGADADLIDAAWREALLGEVSDASGWNPYTTEVEYGFEHAALGADLAAEALAAPCADAGASAVQVDLATGDVVWDPPDAATVGDVVDPVLAGVVATGRGAEIAWRSTADADVFALDVAFGPGDEHVAVAFPWDAAQVATIPALMDEVVALDAATLPPDPLGLPLPSGLARLAEGVWLVKDTRQVHLAGLFSRSAGTLSFVDETRPEDADQSWRFLVVLGDEARAVEVAKATNESPVVTLSCPPPALDDDETTRFDDPPAEGCGCVAAPGDRAGVALGGLALALAALAARRRN